MAASYPPQGEGAFTVGRPEDGEDAGQKVAAWVEEQRRLWAEEDAADG